MRTTVKTLLKSVRQYKKPSIITPIFMMVEAFCECLMPFFMAKMISESVLMQSRSAEDFIGKLKTALGVFSGGTFSDDVTAIAFDL